MTLADLLCLPGIDHPQFPGLIQGFDPLHNAYVSSLSLEANLQQEYFEEQLASLKSAAFEENIGSSAYVAPSLPSQVENLVDIKPSKQAQINILRDRINALQQEVAALETDTSV